MSLILAKKLFDAGQPLPALRLSEQLLLEGVSVSDTPIPQIFFDEAVRRCAAGAYESAFRSLVNGMQLGHYDSTLGSAFEILKSHSKSPKSQPSGRIIFGLGTGRSGSTSLSNILNASPDHNISHEHPFLVRWSSQSQELEWHIDRLVWLSQYYSVVGDVAHWWLPHVDYILRKCPSAGFIALRRSKAETIRSFISIKEPSGLNHWTINKSGAVAYNLWDSCYPKFGVDLSLYTALEWYWETYYEECERMAVKHPDKFKILELSDLSTYDKLQSVLRSLGVEVEFGGEKIHANRGTIIDGQSSIPFPDRVWSGAS